MNIEKMREEFEAAFRSSGYVTGLRGYALDTMLERGSDGEYRSVRIHGAWWGWQASRAAIEVLAPDDGIEDCQEQWGEQCKNTFDCGYNFASMRYDQAIESLGLKVKSCSYST